MQHLVHLRLGANRVDVKVHWLLSIVVVEPQQLGDDQLRHGRHKLQDSISKRGCQVMGRRTKTGEKGKEKAVERSK